MSSQAVAWAIIHKAGSMSAKACLLSIANYANEYGECWASQATIADGAECSVRQVRRILADLQERGLIVRERRGGAGKGRAGQRAQVPFLMDMPTAAVWS